MRYEDIDWNNVESATATEAGLQLTYRTPQVGVGQTQIVPPELQGTPEQAAEFNARFGGGASFVGQARMAQIPGAASRPAPGSPCAQALQAVNDTWNVLNQLKQDGKATPLSWAAAERDYYKATLHACINGCINYSNEPGMVGQGRGSAEFDARFGPTVAIFGRQSPPGSYGQVPGGPRVVEQHNVILKKPGSNPNFLGPGDYVLGTFFGPVIPYPGAPAMSTQLRDFICAWKKQHPQVPAAMWIFVDGKPFGSEWDALTLCQQFV